jgi:hypothetical protein
MSERIVSTSITTSLDMDGHIWYTETDGEDVEQLTLVDKDDNEV